MFPQYRFPISYIQCHNNNIMMLANQLLYIFLSTLQLTTVTLTCMHQGLTRKYYDLRYLYYSPCTLIEGSESINTDCLQETNFLRELPCRSAVLIIGRGLVAICALSELVPEGCKGMDN